MESWHNELQKYHTERNYFIYANIEQLIRVFKLCVLEEGCGITNLQMNVITCNWVFILLRKKYA